MYEHNDGMTDMEREMRIAVNEAAINRLTHKRTNADSIRAMTDEELAELLSSIAYDRETPWSEPFDKKFCKSCPTITCTVEGYHHPMDLNECDFTDGKCPHGSDIIWWLQQLCGEEDKHETD